MEGMLFGFKMRADVSIAVFVILLCIARTSVAVPSEKDLPLSEPSEDLASNDNLCRTEGCLDIAKIYQKNMDLSVEPCDNFYKFACGGFINATVIPGDQFKVNQYSLIQLELNKQLRTSIELPIQLNEPKPFRLVKNFYKACMNEDEIEAQSLKSFRKILKKLGEWPVIKGDEWNDRNFDWKSSIYKARDAGYADGYLFQIYVSTNKKNSTKRSINIDHPEFSLPTEYLKQGLENELVQAYYKGMVDIATILGADKDRAMNELKETLLFELKLLNISMTDEVKKNDPKNTYNPMTFAELKNNYPSIPWAKCFAKLLSSDDAVMEDELVIVIDPNYVASMTSLMEVTSKRVLANYAMWRVFDYFLDYLNRDVQAIALEVRKKFLGLTTLKPRWEECIYAVSLKLPLSVGALYIKNYFSEEAKTHAHEIVEGIKKQFNKTLRKVDWADGNTRKSALEKLAAMSSSVAYSDDLLNFDKLEKYYQDLELSGKNYLETIVNCSVFLNKKRFAKRHEPVKKNDWTNNYPFFVYAFYVHRYNLIQISAGILQGVFFGNDRPQYANYGAIGSIIGPELSHGFDIGGSQFDKDGNLNNWWSTTTTKNYNNRTKCLIDQYGNYTVEQVGLKLNGEKGINEILADNAGIKQTYLAYEDWVSRNQPEKRLSGLDYTSKQMFWISFANSWCTRYTDEALRFDAISGDNSPAEFKIVGSLSNIPQFSEDFNCPIGSKMNPINKCLIW